MDKNSKIYVCGHRGLVGSAIVRKLQEHGYNNLIFRTSQEMDLRDHNVVEKFFDSEQPDYVFLSAAKVGGINANMTKPVEFLLDNLTIQNNVITSSHSHNVKKLLFLGSSCIYPKLCEQPMKEEHLMSGILEPTNEGYALAKIAGLKLCEYYNKQYGCDFISAMPPNIYGINDNFNLDTSHVIPALIRKFHDAKVNGTNIVLWGDGSARREFLYSDDLADVLLFLMNSEKNQWPFINVGSGKDCSIKELAHMVSFVVGYNGKIEWDTTKPNGMPRKLMDNSRITSLGWNPKVHIVDGLKMEYEDYVKSLTK